MAAYAPLGGIPSVTQGQEQLNQNALAEYTRAAQEKQQTALLQQQTQGAQQENQIRAQQLKDQDALTKTITQYDPAKNTINDIPGMVTANGGSGAAAIQAQQGLITQRKNLASLSDEQFAEEQKKADLIAGVHDQVSQAAPEDKQNTYQQGLQQLSRAGVDVSKEPLQYPGDDVFAQHLPAIRLHSAIVAEAEKDRELSAKEQEATAKQTEAGASQQKANAADWKDFPELGVSLNTRTGEQRSVAGAGGMMTPAMMENKYVQLAAKENAGQPLDPSDSAWKKGYEKYKTLVPVANFNLQNSGAAVDAGGNPSFIAQQLAANKMKWGEAVSPRTPQSVKNDIMKQVYKLNPDYDTSEFGLEQDAAKKARSGAWADTRLAYNTAIDHASQLLTAADALKNGDVQKLNSLKNYFSTQFGSPDVTNFSAIANAYNHEVTSVVSKGHITDAEVAQGHATLPDNASPDQIKGVAQAYKNLMTSKRDELDKIIKGGAGNKANAVMGVQAGPQGGANDFFTQFGGKARPQQ
jgi:hypothetical protein